MNILVIGLGSMGKRRVRCLRALGVSPEQIVGFDTREDRRAEAARKYGVRTTGSVTQSDVEAADAVIISVPPDIHGRYMRLATAARRSYFVEASVINEGFGELEAEAQRLGIVAAPSLTLGFHPATRRIRELLAAGTLGAVSNFIYHSGQFLPDWHTYEKVSEFYVSNPVTGAAREIVPFDLSWLVRCFGWPASVSAFVGKTTTIEGAEQIDDTYILTLGFAKHPGTLVVDVVSRLATRRLTLVGTRAQLLWEWDKKEIRIYDGDTKEWHVESYDAGRAAEGYNESIGEQMYIDEIRAFLDACEGRVPFPNTLRDDAQVLKILTSAEESSRTGCRVWLGQ